MDLEVKNKEVDWFDNPSFITTILTILIFLIIVISQSMAVNSDLTTIEIFRNILNHNSIYLIMLLYFILLRVPFGKKYFDYMNVLIIILYIITAFTSLLTLFQTFSVANLIGLILHIVLIIYMIHTFLRGTRFWKEFKLKSSMFNELKNTDFFWTLVALSAIDLAINLVFAATYKGVVIAVFDCIYYILFTRYIYLYRVFLDKNELDIDNTGNMDKLRDIVKNAKEQAQADLVQEEELEKTGILSRLDSVADDLFDGLTGQKDKDLEDKLEDIHDDIEDIKEKLEIKEEEIVSKVEEKEVKEKKKKTKKASKKGNGDK